MHHTIFFFARTEIGYETFSEFVNIKTFVVTICEYLRFLIFEACFKNKNYHFMKIK